MRTKTVGAWLADARRRLAASRTQSGPAEDTALQDASLEAQVLLASVLKKPRAWLISHPEAEISSQQENDLDRLLDRFVAGEPLPYLLGHWEFYGLDFIVTPDVLIPRPETELLVERAVAWLRANPHRRSAADAGTGSGCIAISLASQVADLRVLAVDRSWAALRVARRNAHRQSVDGRVHFWQGDLLSAAAGPLDLVCANLPYIPRPSLGQLPVARHEPRLALDGGPDGLSAIRALLGNAPRWLAPGGLLLLEMQFDQGEAIRCMAQKFLPGANLSIHNDLAGLPRLVALVNTEK